MTILLALTGCGVFLSEDGPPADVEISTDVVAFDAGPDVLVPGDVVVFPDCIDGDDDGYGDGCVAPDCDDNNTNVFVVRDLFVDADDDGYRAADSIFECTGALGPDEPNAETPVDCDDADRERYVETEVLVDGDSDGAFVVASECGDGASLPADYLEDCDDDNDRRSPGETERCNAVDDDCDGVADDENSCGCEVVSFDGFGPYLFCAAPGTFNEQKIFCEQPGRGYRMVFIESQAEQDLLRAEVAARQEGSWRWFIGLQDVAVEGEFRWTDGSSTEEIGFQDFANGEPNNAGDNEHCGSLRADGWDDVSCGRSLPVICEALP